MVRVKEECVATFNCIAHGVLKVGVSVHTEEIHRIDDGSIRSIDPSSPCVDMSHRLATCRGTNDEITNLQDVIGDFCRAKTGIRVVLDASGGYAV